MAAARGGVLLAVTLLTLETLALGPAAQRIAQAFGLASCRLVLDAIGDGEHFVAVPLTDGERRLGTLLIPRIAREDVQAALAGRVRPALEGRPSTTASGQTVSPRST